MESESGDLGRNGGGVFGPFAASIAADAGLSLSKFLVLVFLFSFFCAFLVDVVTPMDEWANCVRGGDTGSKCMDKNLD